MAAGTGFGPLIAGPDGCMVVEMFANRTGVLAEYFKLAEEEQKAVATSQSRTRERLAMLDRSTSCVDAPTAAVPCRVN